MSLVCLAVAVPGDTTLDTLTIRAAFLLDAYIDTEIEWWAPGQHVAGIWSRPLYNPTADPANWATCTWCSGTGIRPPHPAHQFPGGRCNACAGGVYLGRVESAPRPAGITIRSAYKWPPHPQDIQSAAHILNSTWRWGHRCAPAAYIDRQGWLPLDTTDTTPDPRMRHRLRALHADAPTALAAICAREQGHIVVALPTDVDRVREGS